MILPRIEYVQFFNIILAKLNYLAFEWLHVYIPVGNHFAGVPFLLSLLLFYCCVVINLTDEQCLISTDNFLCHSIPANSQGR